MSTNQQKNEQQGHVMFTREELLKLPQLSESQLEHVETLLKNTPENKDKILQWILKQLPETTILIALLKPEFKEICYDNSLDKYWKKYIESIPWLYYDDNKYYMQFRTDLIAFDQAIALYCFDQSKAPENDETARKPWRMLAIQYGSYRAAMKQIGLNAIELSQSAVKNPAEIIKKSQDTAIRMAMFHLTPGFILLGYTYTMIGNYYHKLAKTEPGYATLKIAYYKCAYQAYQMSWHLVGSANSQIALNNASFGNIEYLKIDFKYPSLDEACGDLVEAIPGFSSLSLFSKSSHLAENFSKTRPSTSFQEAVDSKNLIQFMPLVR